jgi:hypothetical protein
LFEQMRDPEGVRMAAFTPEDPDDRNTFDAHMARVRSSPDITHRAVTCDGHLAGRSPASPPEARPRSLTGSTAQSGGKASRPGPWRCSWNW